MEIILQDSGAHASLLQVSEYTPVVHALLDDFSSAHFGKREILWDSISFMKSARSERWVARRQQLPKAFDRNFCNQSTMVEGRLELIKPIWDIGLSVAAHASFVGLPSSGYLGESIRADFNCRSGVILCLRAMGIDYDVQKDFGSDAGTMFNFVSLE